MAGVDISEHVEVPAWIYEHMRIFGLDIAQVVCMRDERPLPTGIRLGHSYAVLGKTTWILGVG
jgi:hypothetical protein